jgi:hypothetical protein
LLLGLCSIAGEVCDFFPEFPFTCGEGLGFDSLEELLCSSVSKYASSGSIDSCSGDPTKLKGLESRLE